jgi:beta-lactam-binding protein with PASTA domain
MSQDEGRPGYQGAGESATLERSSVWPWIALAIVVMVVILFLWLFWRQPQQSSSEAITKKSEIPVVLPQARPEPVLPAMAADASQTPSTRLVPNVLGRPEDSAVRALEDAGYSVSVSHYYTVSKAAGIVVGQTPSGGVALDPGSSVAVVVSANGRATGEVKMPDVVGLTQAQAESKVKAAGLVPYITYGRAGVPQGHVISQWPLAGEQLTVGSEGFIQVQLVP